MVSMIVKAVSSPHVNAGAVTNISAVEGAGGVSRKSAVRGEMSAAATTRGRMGTAAAPLRPTRAAPSEKG